MIIMNIIQENIVDLLCSYTNIKNKAFFRIIVLYKLAIIATMMRVGVSFMRTERIPPNIYSIALAPSGFSKGKSMNILNQMFSGFRDIFKNRLFYSYPEEHIKKIANFYNMKYGIPVNDKLAELRTQYFNSAKFIYEFPIATIEGIRSLRTKLSIAGIGSTNMVIDEIGSTIRNQLIKDSITYGLETYDLGLATPKLLKYNGEEAYDANVPNNILMFGSQSTLLDNGESEKSFIEFLEAGYARRLLFAVEEKQSIVIKSAEERYVEILSNEQSIMFEHLKDKFTKLADFNLIGKQYKLDKHLCLKLLDYENKCVQAAEDMPASYILQKIEMKHRYWKVIKIAGIYAFIESRNEITETDINDAIELVEESGDNLYKLLQSEPKYITLAKHFKENVGKSITNVDLSKELIFYNSLKDTEKKNLLNMAIAYGYKNGIIIQKEVVNDIEFYKTKLYENSDLDNLLISYSNDIAKGFLPRKIKFENLHKAVTQSKNYFAVHHFINGERKSDNVIQGFNMFVIDIDKDLSIKCFKELMADYKYLLYTTKSHTEDCNRFRVIFPMSNILRLNIDEYRHFYERFIDWLPFNVDTACKDIARAWATNNGEYFYNEGKLINVFDFLNDNTVYKNQFIKGTRSLEPLERWFVENIESGNRNHMLYRYAIYISNTTNDVEYIRRMVLNLNDKLKEPLGIKEIDHTIMQSIKTKVGEKSGKSEDGV
jgi:hypothetical protein